VPIKTVVNAAAIALASAINDIATGSGRKQKYRIADFQPPMKAGRQTRHGKVCLNSEGNLICLFHAP
jgi:hypothetical protein